MTRIGQIVVPTDHELSSASAGEKIYNTVKAILEELRSEIGSDARSMDFKIRSHSNTSKSNDRVLASLCAKSGQIDEFRVLFSDKRISDLVVRDYLSSSKLLVVAEESLSSTEIRALNCGVGCRARVPLSKATRFIEDIFVDIFIGRSFVKNPIFEDLQQQQGGLKALFRQKALFFKRSKAMSYVVGMSREVGYMPLSALNKLEDDDFRGRGRAALRAWQDFEASLQTSSVAVANSKSFGLLRNTLDSIPVYGKQLPLRRICRNAGQLSDGAYSLIVLRRSSQAGKSKKLKNKIRSVFGPYARINSFRFIANGEFLQQRKILRELSENGYVAIINVKVLGSEVFPTS